MVAIFTSSLLDVCLKTLQLKRERLNIRWGLYYPKIKQIQKYELLPGVHPERPDATQSLLLVKSSSKRELHDRKDSGTKKQEHERNPRCFWPCGGQALCLQLNANARGALHIRLVLLGNLKTDRRGSKAGLNCSIQWSLASVQFSLVQFSRSVVSDSLQPHGCSRPGLPVHHQHPEFTQTHVHWVSDAIQPSHPLSSPSPAFNFSQHQGLFKWVSSSQQVAKGLELQLQHQSFQWIFRTDFL